MLRPGGWVFNTCQVSRDDADDTVSGLIKVGRAIVASHRCRTRCFVYFGLQGKARWRMNAIKASQFLAHTGGMLRGMQAKIDGRHAVARRNFSLAVERTALIRSLKSAETNWFAMCSDFRDAGLHLLNIKAECRERKISAGKWATENAPISRRWLDKYAELADRWDEFLESHKWSEALPYAPERRPGLWGCFDLMDAKKRFLITHKPQPVSGTDRALEWFGRRPM